MFRHASRLPVLALLPSGTEPIIQAAILLFLALAVHAVHGSLPIPPSASDVDPQISPQASLGARLHTNERELPPDVP